MPGGLAAKKTEKEKMNIETNQGPLANVLSSIAATMAPTTTTPTTPPSLNAAARKKNWLDKWLKIKANHRQLIKLQDVVYEFCRGYAVRPTVGRRLVIHGGNGVGKTHTARAIHSWANSTAMKLPLTHVNNGSGEILDLASSMYLFWPSVVDGFKKGEWDVIDEACEQTLLVLDDIGADHDPSSIGKEKLYYLLERRAQKWTVMTTNVSPERWESKFERRIASRFLRNCMDVDLGNVPDWGTK